jgi:hypothetical protein
MNEGSFSTYWLISCQAKNFDWMEFAIIVLKEALNRGHPILSVADLRFLKILQPFDINNDQLLLWKMGSSTPLAPPSERQGV